MKNVLYVTLMLVINNYALASTNNTFVGKTKATTGSAATATALVVDDGILKDDAIADGKSKCYQAGFKFCYPIDSTFQHTSDETGFYHQIIVEGYNEVPDEYKPKPEDKITPPAGSICYFKDARMGFTSIPHYEVFVTYERGAPASSFGVYSGYTKDQLFNRLKNDGLCETYRAGNCGKKFWFSDIYCD